MAEVRFDGHFIGSEKYTFADKETGEIISGESVLVSIGEVEVMKVSLPKDYHESLPAKFEEVVVVTNLRFDATGRPYKPSLVRFEKPQKIREAKAS